MMKSKMGGHGREAEIPSGLGVPRATQRSGGTDSQSLTCQDSKQSTDES